MCRSCAWLAYYDLPGRHSISERERGDCRSEELFEAIQATTFLSFSTTTRQRRSLSRQVHGWHSLSDCQAFGSINHWKLIVMYYFMGLKRVTAANVSKWSRLWIHIRSIRSQRSTLLFLHKSITVVVQLPNYILPTWVIHSMVRGRRILQQTSDEKQSTRWNQSFSNYPENSNHQPFRNPPPAETNWIDFNRWSSSLPFGKV